MCLAGWPVVDGMHTGFCDGPFPATPTAFVGPQENGPPSCGPMLADRSKPREGVWLQPGGAPPGARRVTTSSGQVVLEEDETGGSPLRMIWYHGVLVEIGVGTNPVLAEEIFNTIGFAPHLPDTRAIGVCARSSHPAVMPTPERLARPLILEQGEVTLDPPLASDESNVSAAQVWKESGPKQSYERYRLILARYSATLPARKNANGSLMPLDHDELSWVVYSSPYSATTAGCGGWGAVVFDAHNGQELISSGWSPGP